MSNVQSIIVYRNPWEQAFWEGGVIGPICGGLLVMISVLILGDMLLSFYKVPRFSRSRTIWSNSFLVIAVMAGLSTMAALLQS
jgi:hypothetical protein